MTDEPQTDIQVVDRRWWARKDAASAGAADESLDKPTYVQELEARVAAKDEELRATLDALPRGQRGVRAGARADAPRRGERSRARREGDAGRPARRRRQSRPCDRGRPGAPGRILRCCRGSSWCARSSSPSSTATAFAPSTPLGRRFDPSCHEAATTVPVTDHAQDGIVVGVIRQGYAIGDDVLRPAVVAVASSANQGVAS